jgi:hypothetical protein
MAVLGLCEQGRAINEAHLAIARALSLNPGDIQALPRLALLTSLRGCEDAAQELFRRSLLAADQADVHYFHAWHQWFWRRDDRALISIDKCLEHDSNCVRAKILRVRIALTVDPRDALMRARETLQPNHSSHPILLILYAVVLAYLGQQAASWRVLDQAGLSESAKGEQGQAAWNVLFGVNPLTARNQYARWLQSTQPRTVKVSPMKGLSGNAVVAPLWRSLPRAVDALRQGPSRDSVRRLA